ncbi:MAG: hypothetical protein U0Q22_16270 [Acidimicrobiales bacterium]
MDQGFAAATMLNWYPNIGELPMTVAIDAFAGTVAVSGFSQAAWSSATNTAGTYLSVGGEFPTAGFVPQQGLTRFAIPSISSTSGLHDAVEPPTATASPAAGSVRVVDRCVGPTTRT